ncbi:hypothetical protein T310_7245 [Rasamsonia emersonii CBS 393.64]|uniref:Uncharacterized protein n=1 Tax=Rasamsonia emersonii (strain ATCC 16479 / CBS 393.64 / IMI 116815) TaxID=1408163 RepID=A0A0F4YL26_RASE3|nr:hypothetical protein T310_7245 [Rasamsonia emersonii CBS 393.64]KKA18805.1 hypothetical protein T310_7245 [Rasamsonia emersonii CBS 393.64]
MNLGTLGRLFIPFKARDQSRGTTTRALSPLSFFAPAGQHFHKSSVSNRINLGTSLEEMRKKNLQSHLSTLGTYLCRRWCPTTLAPAYADRSWQFSALLIPAIVGRHFCRLHRARLRPQGAGCMSWRERVRCKFLPGERQLATYDPCDVDAENQQLLIVSEVFLFQMDGTDQGRKTEPVVDFEIMSLLQSNLEASSNSSDTQDYKQDADGERTASVDIIHSHRPVEVVEGT